MVLKLMNTESASRALRRDRIVHVDSREPGRRIQPLQLPGTIGSDLD